MAGVKPLNRKNDTEANAQSTPVPAGDFFTGSLSSLEPESSIEGASCSCLAGLNL